MTAIFAKALYELEKHHNLILATIVSEAGSSPRGTGSQILVGEAGRILGTIGGGTVEHRAEQMALTLLREKRSNLHQFTLRQNDTEDIGMVCGGDVTVWFQFIDAQNPLWAELFGKLMEQISGHQRGWLVQKLDGTLSTLLDENGRLLAGAPMEAAPSLLADGIVLSDNLFSVPLPVGERAVIFGGGHIALALVPLLKSVGFRVTVMDCRPEYASPERFPDAERVICGDYLRVSDSLTLTRADYVVIMTNGHSHDFEVQEQVLRGALAYVGVIGSRSKTASVNARLREKGVPEEAIQSVHTPIGTAIKAVTPEEIAISIAGEMIYVRALHREAAGIESHSCPMH